MSDSIDNPPPRYTNREDIAAQISQCSTFMLALDKLFHSLAVAVRDALLKSSTEKVAADRVIKEAKHIEEVYSNYLEKIRLGLPDLQSYVLRYIDFIIPMVLGTDTTPEEKKAELDVFLKKTLSAISALPEELAPGAKSVCANSLTLIDQLVKDADVSIKDLNDKKEAKTDEQHELEAELRDIPMREKEKRDALKKQIADVKDKLEDIDIALIDAENNKKKYFAAISTIPNTTDQISDALAKGPSVLPALLTDVFQNVHSDTSKIRKCLEDGSPIDKDELGKETSDYKKIETALKKLATG